MRKLLIMGIVAIATVLTGCSENKPVDPKADQATTQEQSKSSEMQ